MKKNIAIFASGSGTNAENIIRYFTENDTIRVALVLSNKGDAYVLERAREMGVPGRVIPSADWRNATTVLELMEEHRIDFIVLAGFLLRVPELLLHAYPDKIINIHPALLPKFGGKGMYGNRVHEAVVEAGEQETGITIHLINEHYDEGSILFQAKCPVLATDLPEEVAQKVHCLEYKHYPFIIEKILKEQSEHPHVMM